MNKPTTTEETYHISSILRYHTLISKNSLLLRCFVNTASLPLSELA